MDWSRRKVIREARKEPKRLEFWRKYYDIYYKACEAVVENPPSFDRIFEDSFPDAERYKEMRARCS